MVLQSGKSPSLEHRGQQIDSYEAGESKKAQGSEKTQVVKLIGNIK